MTLLYDVYRHPSKGSWGFSVAGQVVDMTEITDRGTRHTQVAAHLLAAEVSKRARMGFVKLPRALYLFTESDGHNIQKSKFVERHPELTNECGTVLFVALSLGDDIASLSKKWETMLEETDITPSDLSGWIEKTKTAKEYVSAPKLHPAVALVVAQWGFEAGRSVIGSLEGMPTSKPSDEPMKWDVWLNATFQEKNVVRDALEHLGWSARALMVSEAAATNETNPDIGGWFSNSKSIAF